MNAALEAGGLGKRYRRTWALRDCNLTIPRGRIAALVGPYYERQPPITGVAQVVRASHTDPQASLLVRTSGPVPDPAWTPHPVTLEDLVLAYLADPSAGALPGPSVANNSLRAPDDVAGLALGPGRLPAGDGPRRARPANPGPDQASDPVQACQERARQFASRHGILGTIGVLLWFLPLFAGLFVALAVLLLAAIRVIRRRIS